MVAMTESGEREDESPVNKQRVKVAIAG